MAQSIASPASVHDKTQGSRNARTGLIFLGVALAMLALGYAAVPLYRMFCQVTGIDGTTQRASTAQAAQVQATGQRISVRFDGNVANGLPWSFHPMQTTSNVIIGEKSLAKYEAKNNSAREVTGTAVFNVSPVQAGKYFNKIECFCFTEQTLKPGQDVEMPVIYYVDPAILDDPDTKDIQQITLSYSFYESGRL
ncbi:cytochrome c oxidase assembly protein [Croceicoccus marinus]|jgi:cytochrome c oxidase assembly protein subunit 11|uniref:Cytochrome c oxidase assembly protein CtaG n=1 Tax=Croceicoccus marinus TaxID=450378 RepID=A0A7G6VX18_9SPHN|nr:cytochrome c oxidase assembly protein [Croceicoccus marinus]QNE06283.1 cytochrome c oxidase assembly protein [Croceicoccus marinus]